MRARGPALQPPEALCSSAYLARLEVELGDHHGERDREALAKRNRAAFCRVMEIHISLPVNPVKIAKHQNNWMLTKV
jgi:hypothetical protein